MVNGQRTPLFGPYHIALYISKMLLINIYQGRRIELFYLTFC